MSKYKAVFFDLDGTLVESSFELLDAINDTMDEFNLPHIKKDENASYWVGHGTLHLLIKAICSVKSISYEDVKSDAKTMEMYECFKEKYKNRVGTRSFLFDGAIEILKTLKENNIKTGIITNKESAFSKILLDVHNLSEFLDIVVSGDTLDVKKPDPKGIFYMMEKLDIKDVKDVLFIGDSDTDIKTAKNANLECWAVPYGYNAGQPIENSNPDKMIESLKDIEVIL